MPSVPSVYPVYTCSVRTVYTSYTELGSGMSRYLLGPWVVALSFSMLLFSFQGPAINYYMKALKRNKTVKCKNGNLPKPPPRHKGKKVIIVIIIKKMYNGFMGFRNL